MRESPPFSHCPPHRQICPDNPAAMYPTGGISFSSLFCFKIWSLLWVWGIKQFKIQHFCFVGVGTWTEWSKLIAVGPRSNKSQIIPCGFATTSGAILKTIFIIAFKEKQEIVICQNCVHILSFILHLYRSNLRLGLHLSNSLVNIVNMNDYITYTHVMHMAFKYKKNNLKTLAKTLKKPWKTLKHLENPLKTLAKPWNALTNHEKSWKPWKKLKTLKTLEKPWKTLKTHENPWKTMKNLNKP